MVPVAVNELKGFQGEAIQQLQSHSSALKSRFHFHTPSMSLADP